MSLARQGGPKTPPLYAGGHGIRDYAAAQTQSQSQFPNHGSTPSALVKSEIGRWPALHPGVPQKCTRQFLHTVRRRPILHVIDLTRQAATAWLCELPGDMPPGAVPLQRLSVQIRSTRAGTCVSSHKCRIQHVSPGLAVRQPIRLAGHLHGATAIGLHAAALGMRETRFPARKAAVDDRPRGQYVR